MIAWKAQKIRPFVRASGHVIFFLCAVSLAFSAEVSGLAQEPADSRLPVNRIVATIRVGELPVSAVVSQIANGFMWQMLIPPTSR
jgi:hypothetical protein